MPKISIITPYYSGERFLKQLLDSTLSQTFTDFEHIIVDDCSPRPSTVVSDLASVDARYQYIRLPKNVGPAAARNIGISAATGRYLCFLDADDIWYASKLLEQYNFMEETRSAFSFHQYLVRESRKGRETVSGPVMSRSSYTYSQLLGSRGVGCSTVMIDRHKVTTDINFPEDDRDYPEDLLAWLKITKQGITAVRLKKVLSEYTVHSGNRSRDKLSAASAVWRAYTQHLSLNRVVAAAHFISYFCWSVCEAILSRHRARR